MRGFKATMGQPDISRGARIVLKDYVKGKLLFVQPPPTAVDRIAARKLQLESLSRDGWDRDGASAKGPAHKAKYVNPVDQDFFSESTPQLNARGVKARLTEGGSKKHFNKQRREKLRRLVPSS